MMRRLTVRAINGVLMPTTGLQELSVVLDDAGTWAAFVSPDVGAGITLGGAYESDGHAIVLRKQDGALYASGPINPAIAILTGSDGRTYTCTVEQLDTPL